MFARTISAVDDRHRRNRSGSLRSALFMVPDNNGIGIPGHDADGIFHRFALDGRGEFSSIFRGNNLTAKPEHCRFEAEPGSCRRFIKESGKDFAGESVSIAFALAHRIGTVEQLLDPLAIKLIYRDDVLHCFPQKHPSENPPLRV